MARTRVNGKLCDIPQKGEEVRTVRARKNGKLVLVSPEEARDLHRQELRQRRRQHTQPALPVPKD